MFRFPALPGLLAITLCIYSSFGAAIDTSLLRLATTSSVQNSGLPEQLISRFEQEIDYQVKVYVVGSGAALRMGRKGLHLAIDDFGTGYSSVSRLKLLPVDNLKIDRSFIKDIGIDSNDDALTSAIIALAHRFDLRVTAEVVETNQQLDFLHAEGCDQVQGYLFAPPMEFSALRTWYKEQSSLARVVL